MSPSINGVDVVWVITCSALVMLMQAGFCLLETGFSRAKNSINVAIKNLFDFCISSLAFWAVGFGLMFGQSFCGLIGTSQFFPGDVSSVSADTTTQNALLTFLLFQMMFCSTSTTIISGAIAERIKFAAYLLVALLVSTVVYPIFGHWAWGGALPGMSAGWLAKLGFIDFAGSTVVHSLGGWASLAMVLIIGPRYGRFTQDAAPMRGHNLTLSTLGALLLWFGWFGFNGGSTLRVDSRIPLILLNTNLAAAAGGAAGLALAWFYERKAVVGQVINGVIAGLVAVTASCHIISPASAVTIGLCAGCISVLGSYLLERLELDDVVGAIPVHGFCGLFGTLSVALFGNLAHLGGHTRLEQFGIQALGALACLGWSFGCTYLVMRTIHRFWSLRSSVADEQTGLNIAEHGAGTDLVDLLASMDQQRLGGDFSCGVAVEPHTEVGQIATEYNRVLERVNAEIKAREAAAEAAQQAEFKYRQFFENAVEGIFQTTADGSYLSANPRLAEIYGYDSPSQLTSSVKNIAAQLYVDPQRRQDFRQIMEAKGLVQGFESQIYRCNGEIIWISENARAVKDAAGMFLYYEGTVEEITQRKNAFALQLEVDAAVAASQAKSLFLANMSHEIRTPLNGVIGMLDMLSSEALDTNHERYVRIAHSSAKSLLGLINNVLDFSKIESGKLDLERIQFNLHLLLTDLVEMFAQQSTNRNVSLEVNIADDIPLLVWGDSGRLRQILMNLLSNALKFTKVGKVRLEVVLLRKTSEHYHLRLAVQDSGIGIPLDRRDKLFAQFSQVDASTTRKYGGTGLGLAICKELVELMGGQIGVDSEAGVGSTFWFAIPFEMVTTNDVQDHVPERRREPQFIRQPEVNRATAHVPETAQGSLTEPLPPFKNRILIVDDNEINQLVACEMLQAAGYQCEAVGDGRAAVETLRQQGFALVLMDCQMPELDGFEATREIRRLEQTGEISPACNFPLPVIALTASAIRGDREKCMECGMNDYATKPLVREQLLRQIGAQIGPPAAPEVPAKSVAIGASEFPQPAAPSEPPAATIDQQILLERCNGDASFARKMLTKFQQRLPQDRDRIAAAITNKDQPELTKLTHSLKGTAGNLAALPLRDAVQYLEEIATESRWDSAQQGLAEFEARVTACLKHLEELLLEGQKS